MDDPIPKQLYDILACPTCKGDLKYTSDKKGLNCSSCSKIFAINDGIPVLMSK